MKRVLMMAGGVLLLFGVLYAAGWPSERQSVTNDSNSVVLVTRVIDGDTVEIEGGQRVRYLGVDAPEANGECFAAEATEYNRMLVEGKRVQMVSEETDHDDYGRLLRYVTVDDTFVSDALIRGGYARVMVIPPDTARYRELVALQDAARTNNVGLWDVCR
jgi:micrococcal nuclease